MGQYWYPVNLDKKEYIHPHKLGSGLKLWEQIANAPGVGAALVILCAAQKEERGGGDLDIAENWHGPERKFPENNMSPGPMPDAYEEIARRTIGRWAGDRIAIVGDYATDEDLAPEHQASTIYARCCDDTEEVYTKKPTPRTVYGIAKDATINGKKNPHAGEFVEYRVVKPSEFRDISEDVCRVIEHELGGKFEGTGWRQFKRGEEAA